MFGRMVRKDLPAYALLVFVLGVTLPLSTAGQAPASTQCSTGACAVHACIVDLACPGKSGCETGLEDPHCRFCGGPFEPCPGESRLNEQPDRPSLRALKETTSGCDTKCTFEERTKTCKEWVHTDERLFKDAGYAVCIHAYAEVLAQCDSCLVHCPAHEVGCARYVPEAPSEVHSASFPFASLLLGLLLVAIAVALVLLARSFVIKYSLTSREDSRILMAEKTVPALKETVKKTREKYSPRQAAGDQAVNDTVRLLTVLDAVGEEQDWQPPPAPPDGKEEAFFADNTQLHAQSYGLVHRATKNENDTVAERTRWGQQVTGIDCGDGWVYLPATNHYLPVMVSGVQVLTKVNKALEVLSTTPRSRPVLPKIPNDPKSPKSPRDPKSPKSRTPTSPQSRTPRRGEGEELSFKMNSEDKSFMLDNSQLKAASVGLRHRKSKNDKDLAVQASKWGETVEGVDCGDGWVKLTKTGTYLPFEVRGLRVLVLQE